MRFRRIALARYRRRLPVGPQHTCRTPLDDLFLRCFEGEVLDPFPWRKYLPGPVVDDMA